MAVIEYHNAGNSEAQQQQALAYLLAQATPGRAVAGVLSGLTVSQTTTASGAVQVAAGAAVAQASASAGAGLLVNDAQVTLNVLSGVGSTPMGATPRNDIMWIDRATLAVGYTAGVPNAVPTDPAIPATAVRLARLRHAANATTIPTAAIDNLQSPTTLAPAKVDDTGWVDVTVNAGFAAINTNERPRVRIRGGVIYMEGGWSNTGLAANGTYTVGKLPAGFAPRINAIFGVGSSTGTAAAVGFIVAGAGDVQIRTSGTLGAYYNFGGHSWPRD